MRALIVDDSKTMRLILGRLLLQAGFETCEAGDGREALGQLAQTGALDLALVDWNMPVMNGLELIQEIRARSEFADMKVMMVTTEAEMARVVQALSAGADEYMMKPFTAEALGDKLCLLGLGPQ